MVLTLLAVATAPVRAQDGGLEPCDAPVIRGPEQTIPINQSRSVTVDAPLRVRYSPGYFEPGGPGDDPASLLTVRHCSGLCGDPSACGPDDEVVSGRVQVLGRELVFLPDDEWAPSSVYGGQALGRDTDLAFQFCTGLSRDDAPPTLGRLREVTSTRVEPRCDMLEGGYRIAAYFEPATDLGPPGSIEYLLYQTRGTNVDGPVVRDRLTNFATDQITMSFVLPLSEAASPICVRVAAVDGLGNVAFNEIDDDASAGDCVDPVQGNFFYPICSAGTVGAPRSGALLTLLGVGLVAVLLVLRLRRP